MLLLAFPTLDIWFYQDYYPLRHGTDMKTKVIGKFLLEIQRHHTLIQADTIKLIYFKAKYELEYLNI